MAKIRISYPLVLTVPSIFEPSKELRSNSTKYQDLSEHAFTAVEKVFLCQQILHSRADEPISIATTNDFGQRSVISVKGMAMRHNISENTVQGWIKKYKKGEAFHDADLPGQPTALDDISVATIVEQLHLDEKAGKPLSEEGLRKAMGQEKGKTAERRG